MLWCENWKRPVKSWSAIVFFLHHRRFTTSSKGSRDSKIQSGKQCLYLMVMGILTTDGEFYYEQRQKLMK